MQSLGKLPIIEDENARAAALAEGTNTEDTNKDTGMKQQVRLLVLF
jgi:hypothetical protein